jgi:hypothetical protein
MKVGNKEFEGAASPEGTENTVRTAGNTDLNGVLPEYK